MKILKSFYNHWGDGGWLQNANGNAGGGWRMGKCRQKSADKKNVKMIKKKMMKEIQLKIAVSAEKLTTNNESVPHSNKIAFVSHSF